MRIPLPVLHANVRIMDGGTTGMELFEPMRGADCLIVADAVNAGAPPGTLLRIANGEIRAFFQTKLSNHQLGLSDLLALLAFKGETSRHVAIIGMVPQVLDNRLGLSEPASAALGFRPYEGRMLGMVVMPWIMSLILCPGAGDEWEKLALGDKQSHAFPGGSLRFMVNAIDGLVVCQMHSVHSPMRGFPDQDAVLAEAASFLQRLLAPAEAVPELDLPAINGAAESKPAAVRLRRSGVS